MSKQIGEDQRLVHALKVADLGLINKLLDENITCSRLLSITLPHHLACLTAIPVCRFDKYLELRETVTRLAYRLAIDDFEPASRAARNCGNDWLADYLDQLQEIIEKSNRRRGLIYL